MNNKKASWGTAKTIAVFAIAAAIIMVILTVVGSWTGFL